MKNKNYVVMVVTMLMVILGITLSTKAQTVITNIIPGEWTLQYSGSDYIKSLKLSPTGDIERFIDEEVNYIGDIPYGFSGHKIYKERPIRVEEYDAGCAIYCMATVGNDNLLFGDSLGIHTYNTTTKTVQNIMLYGPFNGFMIRAGNYTGISMGGTYALLDQNTFVEQPTLNACSQHSWDGIEAICSDDSVVYAAVRCMGAYNYIYKIIGSTATVIAQYTSGILTNIVAKGDKLYLYGNNDLIIGSQTYESFERMQKIDLSSMTVSILNNNNQQGGFEASFAINNNGQIFVSYGVNLYQYSDATAISDLGYAHTNVLVYPNPVTDFVNISGYNEEIFIYSAIGTLVANGTDRIDISGLNLGVYFIKNKQGQYLSKFIKK